MLISLIIPTYNTAATIARCLDSIMGQESPAPFEVIVVDDGSSDDTLARVQAYASTHKNIKIARTEQNGGPGMARNKGVELAAGSWIAFVDADDELESDFFTALHNAVASAGHADMIGFDWHMVPASGCVVTRPVATRDDLDRLAAASKDERLADYLLNRVDCSVIFHLFRRDFLREHAIRFRGGYHEDVDFMFHALLEANGITALKQPIYRKRDTAGSITNTLGLKHIDGYFDALAAMHGLLEKAGRSAAFRKPFVAGVVNVASSRLMRLLQEKIVKYEEAGPITAKLFERSAELLKQAGSSLAQFKPNASFRTKYRIMFETFVEHMQAGTGIDALLVALEDVRNKSWSCYDLHNSVFLAPGEIRTCCKRFFAEDKLKGDVVLMHGTDEEFKFSYQDIEQEKTKLHREINRDNSDECRGCPFLKFENWGKPLEQGIKYISLEYHSICNMRCTYCSDTYYGGKKAQYNVMNVIETAHKAGSFGKCEYVVWGGGEPTVDPAFTKIARLLADAVPDVKQRIITNATLYNDMLADLLRDDRAFIVTSIDAGTEETFKEVRQYKYFRRVLENLGRYSAIAAHNIILKYILLPENSSIPELHAFANLMEEYGLLGCNFQISCDFKTASMTKEQIAALATLYGLLRNKGARFVFTDDLVWQRLPRMSQNMIANVVDHLDELYRGIVEPAREDDIVVWGTGAQAQILMEKSHFLQNAKVAYFVDPRQHMVGKEFRGLPVRAPSALLNDNKPVVIAAVQSGPFIYKEIRDMDLDEARVVGGLIL